MKTPKISSSEFEVMKYIWSQQPPLTSQRIIDALKEQFNWAPQTIKTLIGRLVKKGVLDYDKVGRNYLYSSKLSKDECVCAESDSFLSRVFDGALDSMVLHFAQRKNISQNDLEELKRILNKAE